MKKKQTRNKRASESESRFAQTLSRKSNVICALGVGELGVAQAGCAFGRFNEREINP
ncbi:hypothetical protein LJ655_08805 [Paraburkholderia sp. MMS20-SJTN17]|uniref:Uncharacterized protein n=1 Tax=Paraburkholderia translucens TaxID=2886945 RepID=A0ABS8KB45_9BURK|nr:hypothetical protein [Paraburkholderia sp. MMS20-SJTN17]MCC8401990.1 hypothetical protein [Paraburkholderia sp. MMS20-SJTN17]